MTDLRNDLIRIECKCKVCKTNAEKVGASFPLKADVPIAWEGKLKKATHDLVYIAHERGVLGDALRRQGNIHPVL